MNEQPSNASAFLKVRVLDWVLFTLFIMQTSLFPMFNGAALVNDKAAADPAVMAALQSLQDQGWPSSSGLGAHYYVDSETITDPDELQEYWEEYSLQRDAEYQILTLSLFTIIIMFKYEVRCPAAPFENTAFARLDDCWSLCLGLSEEYGYAEVIFRALNGSQTTMGSYTNGA